MTLLDMDKAALLPTMTVGEDTRKTMPSPSATTPTTISPAATMPVVVTGEAAATNPLLSAHDQPQIETFNEEVKSFQCTVCNKMYGTMSTAERCAKSHSRSVQRRVAAQKGLPAPTFVNYEPMVKPISAPKVVPVQKEYWADAYGSIWRQSPEPTVILTVTSDCTTKELSLILKILLDNQV